MAQKEHTQHTQGCGCGGEQMGFRLQKVKNQSCVLGWGGYSDEPQ